MSNLAVYTTSCPSCLTKQKVNSQAFKLAAGKVNCARCGCMFDAQKHRQPPLPVQKNLSKPTAQRKASHTAPHATSPLKKDSFFKNSFLPFLSKAFWFSLCCISLSAATYQLIIYKQQEWVNLPYLNPIYQKLASINQVALLASDHFRQLSLVIEPAKEFSNATLIAFSFQNISPQEQVLPKVQLIFSDLKGNKVSQRVFEASEYLSADSRLIHNVEPAAIVSAKIEILQPALRGVNYQLQLLTP